MTNTKSNYYRSSRPARPQPPAKKRRKWLPVVVYLFLLVFAGYFSYKTLGWPPHLGQSKASAAKVVIAKPTLNTAQATAMAAQINSVISQHPDMDIGVSMRDLDNDQSYHYGVSSPFIAASISKVLTATLFLHQVEQGQQSLNEDVDGNSASYELQQLIEISDNTAWSNLNDLLTHNALATYAQSIGLQNYDPDQNTLTVDDISMLLDKLYKNELLKPADTQMLMNYMHDANYDGYIVASVPSNVKVYHKVGFLDDRVNDAAIIDNGKHPYVLVIFTKMDDGGDYDNTEGHQVFADITTTTTGVFL